MGGRLDACPAVSANHDYSSAWGLLFQPAASISGFKITPDNVIQTTFRPISGYVQVDLLWQP